MLFVPMGSLVTLGAISEVGVDIVPAEESVVPSAESESIGSDHRRSIRSCYSVVEISPRLTEIGR
jgi:hypothetical protein